MNRLRLRFLLVVTLLSATTGICIPSSLSATPSVGNGKLKPPPLTAQQMRLAAMYNSGVLAEKQSRNSQAISIFQKFVVVAKTEHLGNSALLQAYEQLFNIYARSRNMTGATNALHAIVALVPANADAVVRLSRIEALQGHDEQAVIFARRALNLHLTTVQRASAEMALGIVAGHRKNPALAAHYYGAAVKLIPNDVEAHYNYGVALLQLNQLLQSRAEAETAIKLQPRFMQARLLLAQILQQGGDLAGAAKAYQGALPLDPRNANVLFAIAFLHQQLGQSKVAAANYVTLFKWHPNVPMARFNYGLLLEKQQLYPEAAAQLELAKSAFSPSDPRVYTELLKCYSRSAMGNYNPLMREKFIGLANDAYEKAHKLEPTDTTLDYQLADLLRLTGHFKRSLAIYQARLAKNPTDRTAVFGVADVSMMQLNRPGAIKAWMDYQKEVPRDPVSYQQLATLYEASSNWMGAASQYHKLTAIMPGDGDSVLAEANDYVQAKQPTVAAEYYNDILALDPTAADVPANQRVIVKASRQVWRLTALQGLASLERVAGHPHKALSYLLRAEKDDQTYERANGQPIRSTPFYEAASIYQEMKQPDSAIAQLLTLATARPLDPDVHAKLSALYEAEGNIPQAAQQLVFASQRDKSPLRYLLEEGALYQRHQMPVLAIAVYTKLAKSNPDNPQVIEPLASAEEATGDWNDALAEYTALYKAEPQMYWILDKKASVLTHLKRYDDAFKVRLDQLKLHPDSLQTYADIENIYSLQGKPTDFVNFLNGTISGSPSNVTAIQAMLNFYTAQHDSIKATEFETAFQTTYAGNLQAMLALQGAEASSGDKAGSFALMSKIAVENPANVDVQDRYAALLDAQGKKLQANAVIDAMIANRAIAPSERYALKSQLAQRLGTQGNINGAVAIYTKLLQSNPSDGAVLHSLAVLYNANGRVADMIALCETTLGRPAISAPLRAEAETMLASGYFEQHNMAEARAHYLLALKAVPGYGPAFAGLNRVQQQNG